RKRIARLDRDGELDAERPSHGAIVRAALLKVDGANNPKWPQHGVIELAASTQVSYPKRYVVDHPSPHSPGGLTRAVSRAGRTPASAAPHSSASAHRPLAGIFNDQRAELDSPHSSIVYSTPLSKRNGSPRIGKQPRRSSAPETAQPREQIPIYHLRRFLLHPVSDLLYALQLEVVAQRTPGLGAFGTRPRVPF